MRHGDTSNVTTRANALWGGKGGRRNRVVVGPILALVGVAAAAALVTPGKGTATPQAAFVAPGLAKKAAAEPGATFRVIVQSRTSAAADAAVTKAHGNARALDQRSFDVVPAAAAQLTGAEITALAADPGVVAVVPDAEIRSTGTTASYSNTQLWPGAANTTPSWSTSSRATYPGIAIVDSGVQARTDFGTRLASSVDFVSISDNTSGGDGYGHGTLVAGIAAGAGNGSAGVQPRSRIYSLDVLNDMGVGLMSDVIAACDWILANKGRYNIRVANFSINAGLGASVLFDPLDAAVERLWLNGVVVVTSAGNYGDVMTGVLFSPANDPFVITVGASDIAGTTSRADDFAAPWSASGYTYDGFRKPELSAPGRTITSTVPSGSLLPRLFPGRVTAPGYMWMSGTSFAAPVVAGAAAYLLTLNPTWTPDQVKGALMLKAAVPTGYEVPGQLGVGVVDAGAAASVATPPNPNAALLPFVTTDPATGLKAFDSASWSSAAAADASWASASWSSASWSSASWSSASWASASWADASWASASWADASWASASWADASWAVGTVVE
jgi:serine protease AprX